MGLLSSNDLTAIRSIKTTSFDTACTVRHASLSQTAQGGSTTAWAETATVCRIRPGGAPSWGIAGGDQLTGVVPYLVSLPYDTTIAAGDEVVAGGDTYKVIGFPSGHSFISEIRAHCEKVT